MAAIVCPRSAGSTTDARLAGGCRSALGPAGVPSALTQGAGNGFPRFRGQWQAGRDAEQRCQVCGV